MALSLPTTSNTTGSWSNAAVSNTLTASFFTRDSKFQFDGIYDTSQPAGRNEYNGTDLAISANGDYAIIANRAVARGSGGVEKGFPFIVARSGNTWTQQAILSNQSTYGQSSAATEYNNKYGYVTFSTYNTGHSVEIDDAGDTVIVNGLNYFLNNYAGRVEVWERSGNTWSFSAGIDGASGARLGHEGVRIAPDGLSFLAIGGNSRMSLYVKSGGSWSIDSNNNNIDLGGGWGAYNGSKIVGVPQTPNIYTRYWNGSSWTQVTLSYADLLTSLGASNPTGTSGCEMSSDGNYLFVQMRDANNSVGRIIVYQWDTNTNNWGSRQVLTPSNQTGWNDATRCVSVNSDGSKIITSGDSSSYWYSFERSGSTWTEKVYSRTRKATQIALSKDGLHAIVGTPGGETGPSDASIIEYFEPTGVIASAISNGSVVAHQGRRFRWNANKQRWTPANKVNLTGVATSRSRSAGVASSSLSGETLSINGLTVDVSEFAGKTTTYANASIFPFSSLQAGDQAIALDTGYLYVTDGSGWFRVANSAIVT